MHNEFTAIIEKDGDWFIAYCPEIPGANGQGRKFPEAVPISDSERKELDRRLEAYHSNPRTGKPWDTLKKRLKRSAK
jgi:hypothetical protein